MIRWKIFSILCAAIFFVSCANRPVEVQANAEKRYEFEQPQMGLPFRIVLYAEDPKRAENAAAAAFYRIQKLNDILSDYDSESELSRLSKTSGQKKRVKVSDDLWRVLIAAEKISKISGGAFDVTVGTCVSLWRKARREKKLPAAEKLSKALASVGYQKIRFYPKDQSVELLAPDMKLDLGGIAKGYAIDEALKILQREKIKSALVSGGGDMAMSVAPPGKKGWRIELSEFDAANAPTVNFVLLSHAALATSGDLFQRLEIDGKRYSHIVNPHTGIGLQDHSLVIVIAKNCCTADALSTTVSVLGPTNGLVLVPKISGAAARIIRQPKGKVETFESSRFGKFYDN